LFISAQAVKILAIATMLQLRDNVARPDRNSVGKTGSPKMIIKLTRRECATILAAPRRWLSYPAAREADSIATNGGKQKPLDNAEIERLCRHVSELAGKCDAPPVRRQSDNGAHEWKAPRNCKMMYTRVRIAIISDGVTKGSTILGSTGS
jgi:hypothetical protein